MFEVGVVSHFEAAHRLQGDFGPASRLHGHTYRVEVGVRGTLLRDDGTIFNLGLLQQAANDVINSLNYCNLDEIAAFEGRNTTAERVALYLFSQLAARIKGQDLTSMIVRVWESPHAYASYEGLLE